MEPASEPRAQFLRSESKQPPTPPSATLSPLPFPTLTHIQNRNQKKNKRKKHPKILVSVRSSDSTKSAVRSALLQLLQNDPQSLIALYREDLRTELGRQSLSTSASVSEAVVAGESSSSRKLLAEMNTFQAEVDSQAAAVVAHVEDVIKLLQPPS